MCETQSVSIWQSVEDVCCDVLTTMWEKDVVRMFFLLIAFAEFGTLPQ